MTITGTNFTEASAVRFGTAVATSFTVNSATSITAVSPPGHGPVNVTVTIPAGTSPTSPADQFNYVAPVITKLKPASGTVLGGTTVTITGTNFVGITGVEFGSTPASSFTVKSSTTITAVSPAVETAQKVNVILATTGGTSAISTADRYSFKPAVTNVSPNTGPTTGGTSVTITGLGFALGTKTTKFKFGTTSGTSVNCTSSTTCTVVSPAHAAGIVDVKTVVNLVTSTKNAPADQFTYS